MLSALRERPSQVDEPGTVELKDLRRGSASTCQANDSCEVVAPDEVVAPFVAPWMEERNDLPGHRIDPFGLGVFVVVAALTGEGEIVQALSSPGLKRDDVLHREGLCGEAFLTAAVFADSARAGADPLPPRPRAAFRHSARAGSPAPASGRRAACLGVARARPSARCARPAPAPPPRSGATVPGVLRGLASRNGAGLSEPDTAPRARPADPG